MMPALLPHMLPLSLVTMLLMGCSIRSTLSLPVAKYRIPTYTFGPNFTNPTAVAYINATYYNGSLPTLDISWPVIKLAGVITTNGQYDALGTMFQQIYSFMVDSINARGGIVVNGTAHLLSITWASDDSSMSYLDYLYTQWMNDPQYTAYIAPQQDPQLQSLNSLIVGSNRTFLNTFALASANFAPHYPYIFSAVQPRERIPMPSMDQLNLRAQLYHDDVSSGAVKLSYAGETTSRWGIQNVCLHTHNDPAQILTCNGVRQWINATNLERQAAGATQAELIQIEQDVFWDIDPKAVQQDLYTSSFNLCPDHVDVLVVCGQTSVADTIAVAAALAATELRPKAAFSSSGMPGFTASNTQMATQWPGWTSLTSPAIPPATLPASTFKTALQFKRDWAAYFNVSVGAITVLQVVYSMPLDVLKAALTTTVSLSADDLRVAFLGLNGTYSFVRPVTIDPLTGVNDGSVTWIGQMSSSGLVLAVNVSNLIYPYNWSWSRLQVGDRLNMSQSSINVIIGWVLVMLGCWVAQIVVEQAVFVRRRGGWYQLWLCVVATSLGGAGVWCSQWTMSTALTLTKPTNGDVLPISFSFDVAILAVLPAIILTWSGLYVLMRDVEDNSDDAASARHSAAHVARQILRERKAEKQKRAALSQIAHLYHLKDSMSLNVVVGAVLIALAIGLTRVTLWYNWYMQATIVSAAAGWIVSISVTVVLLLPALLMYFHAFKWRTAAVFMLAGAVMIDWQVHLNRIQFQYATTALVTPTALYTVLLSSTAVQLITGIITAITCFGFIGLQFSRMQLSRNGLSVLVASLENVINKQKSALHHEQRQSSYLQIQADELVRMVETINIVRPIPKEYAWALASCSNTSTFLQQHEHVEFTAANAATSYLTSPSTVGSLEPDSRTSLESVTRRQSRAPLTAGQAEAIMALSRQDDDVLDVHAFVKPVLDEPRKVLSSSINSSLRPTVTRSSLQPSSATVAHEPAVKPDSLQASHTPITNTQQTGWTDSQTRKLEAYIAPSTSEYDNAEKGEDRIVSNVHRSLTTRLSSQAQTGSPQEASMVRCALLAGAGGELSRDSESMGLLTSIGHHTHVDHHGRQKQYEADLVALLNKQSQSVAVAALEHPHSAEASHGSSSITALDRRGRGRSADDFDFTMSAAVACKPTLVELLAHPVCVELLKDELERIHSVENLVFYLHAARYRQLQSARARRLVGTLIYDTFVAENAPQQINISTRQRDTIQTTLKKRGDDACTPFMFREAEREVALLMEMNVMKTFTTTSAYRVCALALSAIDVNKASGKWTAKQRSDSDDGWVERRVSLLASQHSSRLRDVEASQQPRSTTKSALLP